MTKRRSRKIRRFAMVTALLVGTVLAAEANAQTTFHVDAATCPGPGAGTVADPFCSIQVER